MGFDPIAEVNQVLLLIIIVAGIVVLFKYRDRVIMALTGDDRIHLDVNDLMWSLLTCGRLCDGEWTRSLTGACCCCFPSLKGRNLFRVMGQELGVVPYNLLVTNIIVGDLPKFRKADLYLSVETGANPPQVTSVVELANPKTVAFADTLNIRVRRSHVESNVRFVVKEMNTLGSTDICECYLSPLYLIRWRDKQQGPKRIKMDACNRHERFTFPAWILMDISDVQELRSEKQFDVTVMSSSTGAKMQHESITEFKSSYKLVDGGGLHAQEPDEARVGNIDEAKRAKNVCLLQLTAVVTLIVLSFVVSRLYCFACYEKYNEITMFNHFGAEFPLTNAKKAFYLTRCGWGSNLAVEFVKDTVASTAKEAGKQANADLAMSPTGLPSNLDPKCVTTAEDVMKTCDELPIGAMTPDVPVDLHFAKFSLPCSPLTCGVSRKLKSFDFAHAIFIVVSGLLYCIIMAFYGWRISSLEEELAASDEINLIAG
jgi:hypothetical protein